MVFKRLGGMSLVIVLSVLVLGGGCFGRQKKAEYKKNMELTESLGGKILQLTTHSGSITVEGEKVTECKVTAIITGKGGDKKEAKKVAELVKVKFENIGDKLTVKIEKPMFMNYKSFNVDYKVVVPVKSDCELKSENGNITVTDVDGMINALAENGNIEVSGTAGKSKLTTLNGKIIANKITGDITCKTQNGGVEVGYAKEANPVCNASIIAYHGDVVFTGPMSFSAMVDAAAFKGDIKTILPIAVTKQSKGQLTGMLGGGNGKLYLRADHGSIEIK